MCLDDQTLSAYIDGELGEPWKTQVEEHLVHCDSCKSRYEQLLMMEKEIKAARIQDYEFEEQKNRVWNYLKKSVISEEPTRFLKRRFYIPTPVIMGIAAALVCLFAVNFLVIRNITAKNDITDTQIPIISSESETPQDSPVKGEMLQVSATDSVAIARTLDDLTIEDILKLLDERGFEVDLRLKNIEEVPVTMDVTEEPLQATDDAQNDVLDTSDLPVETETVTVE